MRTLIRTTLLASFLMLPLGMLACLWVDPAWGTPFDWGRDLHKYSLTFEKYNLLELEPYKGKKYVQLEDDVSKPPPAMVPPGIPQRIRTSDIWNHWKVKAPVTPDFPKNYQYKVGSAGYIVTTETTPTDPLASAPKVPDSYSDMIMAYYFSRMTFPYYANKYELKSYLVEIGFPTVKPSIGIMSDAHLEPFAVEVLESIMGDGYSEKAQAQKSFRRYNPFEKVRVPKRPATDLSVLIDSLVAEAITGAYWGQPGFGDFIDSHDDLLQLALPKIREHTMSDIAIIRQQAIGLLRHIKDDKSIPLFLQHFGHKDQVMNERIWKALLGLRHSHLKTWVRENLSSSKPDVIAKIIATVSRLEMKDEKIEKKLLNWVKKPDQQVPALMALIRTKSNSKRTINQLKKFASKLRDVEAFQGLARRRPQSKPSRLTKKKKKKKEKKKKKKKAGKDKGAENYMAYLSAAGLARLGEEEYDDILFKNFQELIEVAKHQYELGTPGTKWAHPELLEQVWMILLEILAPENDKRWREEIYNVIGSSSFSSPFKIRLLHRFPPNKSDKVDDLLESLLESVGDDADPMSRRRFAAWAPKDEYRATLLYYLYMINKEKTNTYIEKYTEELPDLSDDPTFKIKSLTVKHNIAKAKAKKHNVKRPKDPKTEKYKDWLKKSQELNKKTREIAAELSKYKQKYTFDNRLSTAGTIFSIWANQQNFDILEKTLIEKKYAANPKLAVMLFDNLIKVDEKRALGVARKFLKDSEDVDTRLCGEAVKFVSNHPDSHYEDWSAIASLLKSPVDGVRFYSYLGLRKKFSQNAPFCDWFQADAKTLEEKSKSWQSLIDAKIPKPVPKEPEVKKNETTESEGEGTEVKPEPKKEDPKEKEVEEEKNN